MAIMTMTIWLLLSLLIVRYCVGSRMKGRPHQEAEDEGCQVGVPHVQCRHRKGEFEDCSATIVRRPVTYDGMQCNP